MNIFLDSELVYSSLIKKTKNTCILVKMFLLVRSS